MEVQLLNVNLDEIEVGETNKMFRDDNDFTPEALQELSESIFKSGVISPILVRPNPNKGKKYQLIAGERRFRASMMVRIADKKRITIPAQIRSLNDEEALEAQVIENLQRENVNPMKEAIAFDWMTMTKKMTTKQISDRIGKSIDYVQERIRLTTLHKDAQELVRAGVLPLKAALKLASVPMLLHKEAMEACITKIEGHKGNTYTFTGMENLQYWLSNNVFKDLAFADFDTNDATLVPSAGSCTSCTKRTRNAGGLFDDIAKKDCCFDGVCFRVKQMAMYTAQHSQAKLSSNGVEVIFKPRGWGFEDELRSKLSKLAKVEDSNYGMSNEITKAQFEKESEDLKNISHLRIAVLVGINRHHAADNNKKLLYLSFKKSKTGAASTPSGSGATAADRKKEKDKQSHQRKQNFLEKYYTAEAILKKSPGKLTDNYLKKAVAKLLTDDYGDSDAPTHAFKALGIGWEMSKYDAGKSKKLKVTGKEENIDILIDEYGGPDEDEVAAAIDKLKSEDLTALLVYALYQVAMPAESKVMLKQMKIDSQAIANKAKSEATAWLKAQAVDKVKAGKGSIVQKAKTIAGIKRK